MKKFSKKFLCFILSSSLVTSSFLISSTLESKAFQSTSNINNEADFVNTDFTLSELKDSLGSTELMNLATIDDISNYLSSNEINSSTSNTLPISIDNSETKYFPKIGNQGNVGSCNSWATVYYQMTYSINKALDRNASQDEHIMSPTWIYTLTNKGINYGSYYSDVLKVLSEIGSVSITHVPIITKGSTKNVRNIRASKDFWLEASKYRVKEYYSIGSEIDTDIVDPTLTKYTSDDILSIKKALAMGEILSVSTHNKRWSKSSIKDIYNNDANIKYKGEKIITRVAGKDKSTHRLTIVGYNDDIIVDINKNGTIEDGEKGAFKLANSWGTSTDNKGYIWMCYDALLIESLIDTNKFRNANRTVGFYNIIGFTVDIDSTDDPYYAAIDVQTKDLESLKIEITATDAYGNTSTFNPAPFNNALKNGLGPYPFNTKNGGDRGEFYIDLTNVAPNLYQNNFNDFKWEFKITDTSTKKDIIIHSIKIYDKNNDSLSNSIIDNPITLNNNSINVCSK